MEQRSALKSFRYLTVFLVAAFGCSKKPDAASLTSSSSRLKAGRLDFGKVALGSSADAKVLITNTGGTDAKELAGSVSGTLYSFKGGKYPGTGGSCGSELAKDASCEIVLAFTPKGDSFEELDATGQLTLKQADDVATGLKVPLAGKGGRCVETEASLSQGMRAQWSTFEAASTADTTAQSFVSTFTGETDGVSLVIAQGKDFSAADLALGKVVVRLTKDCPNSVSGVGYPCEEALGETELGLADIPADTDGASGTKKSLVRFKEPVALEKDATYWIVVSSVDHTAGFLRLARNTVEPDAYTGGVQIIGVYPESYSRFEAWDLAFDVAQCKTYGE